jgi:adenylate cyclase
MPPARRLEGLTGHGDLAIPSGRPLLIGRASSVDLSIPDPAVSRIHAEVESMPAGLRARDLGSVNGTFVNGALIVEALLQPGDVLTIGRPAFRLLAGSGVPGDAPSPPVRTVVPSGVPSDQPAVLRQLLAVAQSLSGCVDVPRLCAEIVERTFEVVTADRTALLVPRGPEGTLVPVASRNRIGEASAVQVPRAIAGRAATSGRVVLTESALDDAALQSGSVVAHRVRSAIAVPLLAGPDRVVGVLYADRIAQLQPFTDADAQAALAFAGLAAISLARQETIDSLQRQGEAQRNLERFFAPDVAAAIAAAGGPLAAGGERRTVTVLFSDIRGFTPLAEAMAPDGVAELLTEYFSAMADAGFAHGGTLDKFLGDGLLAVWGAPLDAPGGSSRALAAALAMRQEVAALNRAWTTAGRPPLGVGFGLARGEVFAGRIGSAHRLDYTVIGDVVNVAARLCKAAAADEVLLTGAVRDDLTAPAELTRRPDLAVRGRTGPVEVWGG